ncbi:DNA replication protein [Cellulophaga phage phi46:3]|uniref:DNA replication protein n=1 Tax=Cellulophaga phage phi46:3 TaxID=1327985 RepID=S0A1S5_9CAUD|nr:DNA replication protein [Cellulophaga phage phi46:3]AGO48750.1 DNA replication protein [Cellulophaga phage phi46:3]
MENQNKIIGKRKYEALKALNLEEINDETIGFFNMQFPDLTIAEALKKIEAYEEKHPTVFVVAKKATPEKKQEPKPFLTKELLWEVFNRKYFELNKVKYSRSEDSIENLKPLVYYFIGDFENFKKCKNVSPISAPDKNKGLLIIGGYGNGKTSVMKAMEESMKFSNFTFKTKTANDVVLQYEACETNTEKELFWKDMVTGVLNFDDLLTEREANNYGKINIFKDILEKRYDANKRTYATCNFNDEFPDDVSKGLEQFGLKYGSRVFDRLFSMFNVVVFKGGSQRK